MTEVQFQIPLPFGETKHESDVTKTGRMVHTENEPEIDPDDPDKEVPEVLHLFPSI